MVQLRTVECPLQRHAHATVSHGEDHHVGQDGTGPHGREPTGLAHASKLALESAEVRLTRVENALLCYVSILGLRMRPSIACMGACNLALRIFHTEEGQLRPGNKGSRAPVICRVERTNPTMDVTSG